MLRLGTGGRVLDTPKSVRELCLQESKRRNSAAFMIVSLRGAEGTLYPRSPSTYPKGAQAAPIEQRFMCMIRIPDRLCRYPRIIQGREVLKSTCFICASLHMSMQRCASMYIGTREFG